VKTIVIPIPDLLYCFVATERAVCYPIPFPCLLPFVLSSN